MGEREIYEYDGYYRIDCRGYLLHRLIVEIEIGKDLTEDEVVHHKNGDKLDNRIENLEVMSWEDHNKLHLKEIEENSQKCKSCGVIVRPNPDWPLCYSCWLKDKYSRTKK